MELVELDYSTYYDKVYGGWLGKSVGGAVGAQVEGQKRLHSFTEETAFPEKWPPNDDLDLQVLWLHAIYERGLQLTSRDLAEEWWEHCWYHFNEYGRFLKNFARGIDPPYSGWFDNEYFRESMGSPIRSEVWGFIFPGNPDLAAAYAERDAVLDHWRDSVWAEQFYAAIESLSFFESDLNKLIETGLRYVPSGSKLRALVELVLECRRRGLSWVEARSEVLRRFGNPDATSVHQNVGFTLIALLWGEYDFGRTILIALNSGYDTDCTAATAGAILGVILGASRLPEKWVEPLHDSFEMGFPLPRESYRISDLAHETCAAGIAASRLLNKRVRIVNMPKRAEELAARIPIRSIPGVELHIDYLGLPAIGGGEVKQIAVKIVNNGSSALSGWLELEAPEGWSAPDPIRVSVPPCSSESCRLQVKAPASGLLWDQNILRARFVEESGRAHIREFGLAGSKLWLVLGPFYDSPSWLVDRADIEEPYVDERLIESRGELELFKSAIKLSSPTSLLPLNKVVGFAGECCLYLLHRLYSPDERDVFLVIGAQGDVKVWLNGSQLMSSSSQAARSIWNPLMHWYPAHLRRGENRVVIKYAKKTREPLLSFDVYKENVERKQRFSVWQVDLASIL
ncbi:MAG: ADP-ribosylglycohydrolase family protein [Thermofilaceae archaeon]